MAVEMTHGRIALHRLQDLFEHRLRFAVGGTAILLLAILLAVWLAPQPHSDWGYYWAAAGVPGYYERGGFALWLLAIPKALGASPVVAALLLNTACVIALLWLLHRLDTTPWRIPSLLVAGYLLLIAPFLGIVQLDLVATTLLAFGIWLAASQPSPRPGITRLALAAALVTGGVSSKPQFALVIWAMTLFALPFLAWGWRQRRTPTAAILMGVLLAGSIAGFALDSGLRSVSGRSEAIRTNSAVTLYGGLLVSSTERGCGYWSVEAAEAAKADLDRPLHVAVMQRLAERPALHWATVVQCKLPHILHPPPYALYWLVESPNIRSWLGNQPNQQQLERAYHLALRVERKAYSALTLAIVALALAITTILYRRKALHWWLPALWPLSFWGVHTVFEIQGRYFLGMYLLMPLICLVALSLCAGAYKNSA